MRMRRQSADKQIGRFMDMASRLGGKMDMASRLGGKIEGRE